MEQKLGRMVSHAPRTYEELLERVAQLEQQQQQQQQQQQLLLERERQAEESARLAAAQLGVILDNVLDGVFVANAAGELVFTNPAMRRITGHEQQPPAGRLRPYVAATEAHDRAGRPVPDEELPVVRVLRGETVTNVELEVRRSDTGRSYTAVYSGAPVLDAEGKVSLAVITVRDITARSQAEEALRASRAKLEAALASMAEAVFVGDAEGRLTDYNDEFVRYHRFRDREDCSKKIDDCPTYLDVWLADGTAAPLGMWAMPRALRGETGTNVEYRLRRKDTGETWWGSYCFGPIRGTDGKVVGAVVAAHEITERKRAEAALERREQQLRVLIDNVTSGVAVIDASGQFTLFNPRFLEMFALAPGADILNIRSTDWGAWKVFDTEGCLLHVDEHPVRKSVLTRQPVLEALVGVRLPSGGDLAWMSISAIPLLADDGSIENVITTYHDITELTRAQEALRASEQKYRSIFESSLDAIFLAQPGGPVTAANPAACAMFGMSEGELCRVGRTGIEDAADPRHEAAVAERARTGRVWYEGTHVRKDGSKFPSEVSSVIMDRGARSLVILRDITDRKRAEEALRESEQRLRALGDNLPNGAVYRYQHDADGRTRFLHISAGIERLTGVQPQEILRDASALHDQILPEDRLALGPAERVSRESLAPFELEIRQHHRETGELRWALLRSVPTRLPTGETVWDGIHVDITERKRAETRTHALQEITASLAVAATSKQVGDVVLDQAARTMGAAVAALGLVVDGGGVQVRSSLGVPDDVLAHWQQRRLDSRTVLTDAARNGRAVLIPSLTEYAAAYPHTLAEVGTFALQAVAGVPLTVGDRVLGAITFIFNSPREFSPDDVAFMETIARLSAQAVERARLYETLQAQAKMLASTNELLREADRRKDEFLAVLSHELRNPLAPIRNGLYILERAAPGSEQAKKAHAIIARQVTHLTQLVDDLLDATRIARGKVQLRRERLELGDLIRRAAEDHRPVFATSGVALEASVTSRPVWVHGDPTRLSQIVGNLLQNAAKFTPTGGRVEVSLSIKEGKAVLRVEDNGMGIAPEMLGRIFEPFTQTPQALDRRLGGLGLGLALANGLLEHHGGSIEAASEGSGYGAVFTVRLPLDVPPADESATPAREQQRQCRRILVVEDNADAADSLREVLELDGHTVAVAYTGADGTKKARQFNPEVVLCDIGLPEMDGYAVARAFRDDEALRGVFLVALSGYALPEDIAKATEAGFDRHLAKPPSLEQVEKILAEAPTRERK